MGGHAVGLRPEDLAARRRLGEGDQLVHGDQVLLQLPEIGLGLGGFPVGPQGVQPVLGGLPRLLAAGGGCHQEAGLCRHPVQGRFVHQGTPSFLEIFLILPHSRPVDNGRGQTGLWAKRRIFSF